jgi:hypothetical protein
MLPMPPRPVECYQCLVSQRQWRQSKLTYHTSVVRIVDDRNEVAIITTTTQLGSNRGCLGSSVLRMNGIARGRANVSSPTTPGGCYLIPDCVGLCQRAAANRIPHRDREQRWDLRRECPKIFGSIGRRLPGRRTEVASPAAACELLYGSAEDTIIMHKDPTVWENARNHWHGPERLVV